MSDFFEKLKNGKEKIQKFGDEQKRARSQTPLPIMMLNDALPLLVVVTFILLGCLGDWWHPGRLVFLIIPIYYMTAEAIIHKSLALVPIAPITVAVYLSLGCIGGLWHPYWAIFVAIPVYYMLVAAIKGASWSKIFDIVVPILTVGIYLVLGFVLNAWHPGWVIFFAIPLYYTWKGTMHKYRVLQGKDEPTDEEKEDFDVDTPFVKIKFKDEDNEHSGINPDSVSDDAKTPDDQR